jgi:hypothetical protein
MKPVALYAIDRMAHTMTSTMAITIRTVITLVCTESVLLPSGSVEVQDPFP